MKKMVILMCCLMWINFFGLPAAAQYVRPGWFVVDKVEGADGNFEAEKHGADKVEEPEADIVLGAEESSIGGSMVETGDAEGRRKEFCLFPAVFLYFVSFNCQRRGG